ncbi:MAG: hypothetical protein ACSW8F_04220, partial [bacterium]
MMKRKTIWRRSIAAGLAWALFLALFCGSVLAAPQDEMAEQIAALEEALAEKYEKPERGIPEYDLDPQLRNRLGETWGLARNALLRSGGTMTGDLIFTNGATIAGLPTPVTGTAAVPLKYLTDALAEKQDTLLFDSAPTAGSANPVTSGGVFSALHGLEAGVRERLRPLDYWNLRLGLTAPDAAGLEVTFDQKDEWVHAGDALDTLRQYLTVTARDAGGGRVPVEDYVLTGSLTAGVSSVGVLYGALSAAFTVKVTAALPAGYTQFDYIEPLRQSNPTESQRILTKKYPDLHAVSLNLLFGHSFGTPIGEAENKTSGFVLGGRASASWTTEAFNVNVFTSGVRMNTHGTDSALLSVRLPANTRHRLVYTNTAASPSSFSVDGGASVSIPWAKSGAANVALAVGARQKEGEAALLSGGVQIGEFELTALDGTVLGHYIPCVRESDFVIGLYETVDGVFYTAADTTRTTIDHINCMYMAGNWAPAPARSADYANFTRSVYAACPMGSMQAFDIAAGKIFVRRSTANGSMVVIDCATGLKIADYTCPTGHGNSVSFRQVGGAVKAAERDTFPLLLVAGDETVAQAEGTQMEKAADAAATLSYELRVTKSGYEIVNTYRFQSNIVGFFPALSVDEAAKIGYTLGSTINSTFNRASETVICLWDMENLTENGDGTCTPALLSTVTGPHIDVLQGQQLHDGLLWVGDGVLNVTGKIHAIDPLTGELVCTIDTGVKKELESVAWTGDRELVV